MNNPTDWLSLNATVGGPDVPDVSALSQWGPAGITASVFASVAWLLFKALMKTLDLERAQNEELRAENRELNRTIRDQFVPTLTTTSAEIARMIQTSTELARVLQARRDGDR